MILALNLEHDVGRQMHYGISIPHVQHLYAVEKFRPSQNELLHHPAPPSCLFGDINSFWKDKVLKTLQSMQRKGVALNRDTLKPIIKEGDKAMKPAVECVVHGRRAV